MKLLDLGFTKKLQQYCLDNSIDPRNVGRVIAEHKERYDVGTDDGVINAEVTGRIIYEAEDRSDFPGVGDWVVVRGEGDLHNIEKILPRSSVLKRKAVSNPTGSQIIATNIDYGLIVQALNRDFNINRLERYVTICNDADIHPIVLLSKADLVDKDTLASAVQNVKERLNEVQVIATSAETQLGLEELENIVLKYKTYCLLGSSGVGKSTIINKLIGYERMKTSDIGSTTNKGRHTTTNRQLIVLGSGGILVDNPGLREVGVGDAEEGLESTFSHIAKLAKSCRFNDCKHVSEKGCAILNAIDSGDVDSSSYENYMRMQREIEHYQSSDLDRRQKGKARAKMVKDVKKFKRHRH